MLVILTEQFIIAVSISCIKRVFFFIAMFNTFTFLLV